jgi:hypothetical protein
VIYSTVGDKKMDEETIKLLVIIVPGLMLALGVLALLYMWRPERLKKLEEEAKLRLSMEENHQ